MFLIKLSFKNINLFILRLHQMKVIPVKNIGDTQFGFLYFLFRMRNAFKKLKNMTHAFKWMLEGSNN